MSSDSAQAQELAPAKRAMGFWPKIVVAVIIIVAGFMYIRSVAHKDMVIPLADVASPPPAETQDTALPDVPLPVADIQLEGKGMSDAVPVTIGSVITEEAPVISAGAPSETDGSANQSEQQAAQGEPETLAPPMMRETAEAASVEPDQPAAEMPAPETESVMVPPVIPAPPVAPVEQPAQETAVAESLKQLLSRKQSRYSQHPQWKLSRRQVRLSWRGSPDTHRWPRLPWIPARIPVPATPADIRLIRLSRRCLATTGLYLPKCLRDTTDFRDQKARSGQKATISIPRE